MPKKLLVISGPTSTGKTDLAIKLAKKYNGELVSADSRQIYEGMDIGTGKDHPKDIKIHLVDIAKPNDDFSVAAYRKLALSKIEEIIQNKKLPIIVGGTGLYISSILNNSTDTFSIKPNKFLRLILNHASVSFLQKIYSILNYSAFKDLNNSEKHNPHRLIRKIEIELFNKLHPAKNNSTATDFDYLHLSLTAPSEYVYSKIDERADKRLEIGLLDEIKNLTSKYSWSSPGLNCLAYKEFKPYFENKKSLEECVTCWKFDEHAYSRRQKTWFKKQPNVNLIDITNPQEFSDISKTVAKWYNKP